MTNRSVNKFRQKGLRYDIDNPEEKEVLADPIEDKLMIIDQITRETKAKYQEVCKHIYEDDFAQCNYEYEEVHEVKPLVSTNHYSSQTLQNIIAAMIIALVLPFLFKILW